jgi:hypothetical protein
VVKTVWDTPDIWLRRSFQLDSVPTQGDISLIVHHDEDAEIYLNGKLVKQLKGFIGGYTPVALPAKAMEALRAGQNTLAVHCHQTTGGQYIDVGMAVMVER